MNGPPLRPNPEDNPYVEIGLPKKWRIFSAVCEGLALILVVLSIVYVVAIK